MDDQNSQHLQSDEDLEAILRLAVRQQSKDTRELRQRLHDSAAELGITPEDLAQAEEDYRKLKVADEQAIRAREEAKLARTKRLKGLVGHWMPFIAVNIFLHFINFRFSPHSYWAFWPLMGWGIGMVSHTWSVLFCSEESEEVEDRAKQAVLETNLRRRGYSYVKDGHEIRVTVGKPKDDLR